MLRDAENEALQCMHFERQAFISESTDYFSPPRILRLQPLGFDGPIKSMFMKIDIFRSKYIDTLL